MKKVKSLNRLIRSSRRTLVSNRRRIKMKTKELRIFWELKMRLAKRKI
jgi:hypothetical protein